MHHWYSWSATPRDTQAGISIDQTLPGQPIARLRTSTRSGRRRSSSLYLQQTPGVSQDECCERARKHLSRGPFKHQTWHFLLLLPLTRCGSWPSGTARPPCRASGTAARRCRRRPRACMRVDQWSKGIEVGICCSPACHNTSCKLALKLRLQPSWISASSQGRAALPGLGQAGLVDACRHPVRQRVVNAHPQVLDVAHDLCTCN